MMKLRVAVGLIMMGSMPCMAMMEISKINTASNSTALVAPNGASPDVQQPSAYTPEIIDEKSFNNLRDDSKYFYYQTLLINYEKLRADNSAQARSQLEAELQRVKTSNLDKEREIRELKKQLKKKPWKVVGITIVSTLSFLTVLGRLIDQK